MFKHYTLNQVVLPLDLDIKLQENDIAYTINELVESIPAEAFEGFLRQTGRPAYHPRMMMKRFLLMALNLRKYTVTNDKITPRDRDVYKKSSRQFSVAWNLFIYYFWLVMSQPL